MCWIQHITILTPVTSIFSPCSYLPLSRNRTEHSCCGGTVVQFRATSVMAAASIKPYPNVWLTKTKHTQNDQLPYLNTIFQFTIV